MVGVLIPMNPNQSLSLNAYLMTAPAEEIMVINPIVVKGFIVINQTLIGLKEDVTIEGNAVLRISLEFIKRLSVCFNFRGPSHQFKILSLDGEARCIQIDFQSDSLCQSITQ